MTKNNLHWGFTSTLVFSGFCPFANRLYRPQGLVEAVGFAKITFCLFTGPTQLELLLIYFTFTVFHVKAIPSF